jgi:hypothetical protein
LHGTILQWIPILLRVMFLRIIIPLYQPQAIHPRDFLSPRTALTLLYKTHLRQRTATRHHPRESSSQRLRISHQIKTFQLPVSNRIHRSTIPPRESRPRARSRRIPIQPRSKAARPLPIPRKQNESASARQFHHRLDLHQSNKRIRNYRVFRKHN